jgi:hypothetical protein
MLTTLRAYLAPLVAVLSLALAGTATAGPSASIEQVRNGSRHGRSRHAGSQLGLGQCRWLQLALSREPFDRVSNGDGWLADRRRWFALDSLAYAVKKSDSYAIDFITHYQRLLPHVGFGHAVAEVIDPLSGVTGVSSTVTTAQIPTPTKNLMVDPDGAESEPAALQPSTSMAQLPTSEQAMTLFGGTLLDVTYVSEGDVTLPTGTSETVVRVRFSPASPRPCRMGGPCLPLGLGVQSGWHAALGRRHQRILLSHGARGLESR